MAKHLIREIDKLKKKIISVSAFVEENLQRALKALEERDIPLAQRVIESDREVDQLEVDVEEECLKVLALHQPVAADLRFIVAVLKINNDVERIGDLAVNLAQRAATLAQMPPLDLSLNIPELAEKVRWMVSKSLDSLVNMDIALATKVCAVDDEVDEIHRQMYSRIQDEIRKDTDSVELLINYLTISRYLERIADHATNIAEDAIYLVTGEIVRHRAGEFPTNAESAE